VLGVEEYQILATLDGVTCALCGSLDGVRLSRGEFEEGTTAPPFHPWCRCTTAPWFEGDEDGERLARNAEGEWETIPAGMSYAEWQDRYVDKDGERGIINSPIERKHPLKIEFGFKKLGERQKAILENIPNIGDVHEFAKRDVKLLDLSALTASTGHEYAMFTNKGLRVVVHGNQRSTHINDSYLKHLIKNNYRFSGHTHVGRKKASLTPSQGDIDVLNLFNQKNSIILNSVGEYAFIIPDKEDK